MSFDLIEPFWFGLPRLLKQEFNYPFSADAYSTEKGGINLGGTIRKKREGKVN